MFRSPEPLEDLPRTVAYDDPALPALKPDELEALGENPQLHIQPYVQLLEVRHPVDQFMLKLKKREEQTIAANATGFVVRSRGMSRGLEYRGDVMNIGKLYDIDELRSLGGIVDYVVGTPLTKVFVLAEHPDPKQQHYLNLYKMGEGPLYSFFIPYHLVHFEVPNAMFTLQAAGMWDVIYPHCSYFSRPSLRSLFTSCGFELLTLRESFSGQYLSIEAVPGEARAEKDHAQQKS